MIDPAAFVRANTMRRSPSLVPEIVLHLADDALPLWQSTEAELDRTGLPPPFWAFAWAGGQALARHLLDRPALVRDRRVLDVGAGGGIVAIAAAKAGAARVVANEVDPFALAAIAANAALNDVSVDSRPSDILDGTADADVVVAADVFYELALAERTLAFLRRAARAGSQVLVGDPRRTYLPLDALEAVETYAVPVLQTLEDGDTKLTTVWRLAEAERSTP